MPKEPKTYIFPINPVPWVGYDRNRKLLFIIPEICDKGDDKRNPCQEFIDTGYCPHTLSSYGRTKKKRILRYIAYKDELRERAAEIGFKMPYKGAGITFFLPMPKRWTKKTKRHKHLGWHDQTPDLSNLIKAFEDALCKTDRKISHYAETCKKWVNFEQGWIEVTMHGTSKKHFQYEQQESETTPQASEESKRENRGAGTINPKTVKK